MLCLPSLILPVDVKYLMIIFVKYTCLKPGVIFICISSWLHAFIWPIFLKLTPFCWILDDFLCLMLCLFLHIFSLQMCTIDHDGNPSRLSCLTCCLICTNCSLVYNNRLFVGWLHLWSNLSVPVLLSVANIWVELEKLIIMSNIIMSKIVKSLHNCFCCLVEYQHMYLLISPWAVLWLSILEYKFGDISVYLGGIHISIGWL